MTDQSTHERLRRGEVVQAGNGLYQLCGWCEQVIRINKPILGSMHICLTEAERLAKDNNSQLRNNQRAQSWS